MRLSTLVEIAADLRRRAVQLTPPFSTKRIIAASMPGIVVTGSKLPDGMDEVVRLHDKRPIIVYQRSLSSPEQRIAIAHGLAHVLFDDETACLRVGSAGIPAIEERADAFAVELLAPLTSVSRFAQHGPSSGDEHEIYLDHVDGIASLFAVPSYVIDSQIRRLVMTDKIASHRS